MAVIAVLPTLAAGGDDGWAKLYFRIPFSDGDERWQELPQLGVATGIGELRYEIPFAGESGSAARELRDPDASSLGYAAGAALHVPLSPQHLSDLTLDGIAIVDGAEWADIERR